MPSEIDPRWEYWVPEDEEIEEILAAERGERVAGFDRLGIDSQRIAATQTNLGFRFGKGRPDTWNFKLARARPERIRETKCKTVQCPGCSRMFAQRHHTRIYCSHRCRATVECGQHRRVRPQLATCPCGREFSPQVVAQRFCSRRCASQTGGGVIRLDYAKIAAMYAAGIGTTFIARELGTTPSACRKALKKMGIATHRPNKPP